MCKWLASCPYVTGLVTHESTLAMFTFLGKIPFWLKTVVAFAAGITVALYWGKDALPVLHPIGHTYIRAIKLPVAPLAFCTLPPRGARLGRAALVQLGVPRAFRLLRPRRSNTGLR